MQSHLVVGPIPINGFSPPFVSNSGNPSISASAFSGNWLNPYSHPRKPRRRWVPPPPSSSFTSAAGIDGEQNHYSVLGVARGASSADIKRAYRLLALKVITNFLLIFLLCLHSIILTQLLIYGMIGFLPIIVLLQILINC